MAMGMADLGRRRHSWMAMRYRLGRHPARSMAFRLEDPEKLFGRFRRCAKDHAPEGNVDLKSHLHRCVPPPARIPRFSSSANLQGLLWVECGSQMRTSPDPNPTRLAEPAITGTP